MKNACSASTESCTSPFHAHLSTRWQSAIGLPPDLAVATGEAHLSTQAPSLFEPLQRDRVYRNRSPQGGRWPSPGPPMPMACRCAFRCRRFTKTNQVLVVNADTWKTWDKFMKTGRSQTLSGGCSAIAGATHMMGLLLAERFGLKVNVPYEGSGETLAALAGKHIDFVINVASTSLPLIEGGRLRPLLLVSDERDPFFPDVPVPKELGFSVPALPGIRGIVAPPKTPAAIVKVLEEATSKAVKEAAYVDWAKKRKMVIKPLNPQEFGKDIAESYPKVEKIQQKLKD